MLDWNYTHHIRLDADLVLLFCCCWGFYIRFMYIIRSDVGQPLRDELAKSPQKILASAFSEFLPKSDVTMAPASTSTHTTLIGEEPLVAPSTDASNAPAVPPGATSYAYFQGLALIKTLVKSIPGWLQSNRIVFDTLVLVWKSPARISRLQNEQELSLVQASIIIDKQLNSVAAIIFLLIGKSLYQYFVFVSFIGCCPKAPQDKL